MKEHIRKFIKKGTVTNYGNYFVFVFTACLATALSITIDAVRENHHGLIYSAVMITTGIIYLIGCLTVSLGVQKLVQKFLNKIYGSTDKNEPVQEQAVSSEKTKEDETVTEAKIKTEPGEKE